MKIFQLDREIQLRAPLERVFTFFSDPFNLETLTPPWLRFRVVSCSDESIREGTRIDYRLRLHGIPLRWRSRITDWEPGKHFVDEQERGPYRLWRHLHEFEEQGEHTLVRDRVVYAVLGGSLVNRLFVRRDVERIFDYRSERIRELLETGEPAIPSSASLRESA
jgi:ligand-binding SRPBCC domain-containing protein